MAAGQNARLENRLLPTVPGQIFYPDLLGSKDHPAATLGRAIADIPVTLNVGGKRFEASWTVLGKLPDTRLGERVREREGEREREKRERDRERERELERERKERVRERERERDKEMREREREKRDR